MESIIGIALWVFGLFGSLAIGIRIGYDVGYRSATKAGVQTLTEMLKNGDLRLGRLGVDKMTRDFISSAAWQRISRGSDGDIP